MDVVIDLSRAMNIKQISAGFLEDQSSWIFFPSNIEFAVSTNNNDFDIVKTFDHLPKSSAFNTIKDFSINLNSKVRYIRVKAKNIKICPKWHFAAGGKAWIFIDEIMVK